MKRLLSALLLSVTALLGLTATDNNAAFDRLLQALTYGSCAVKADSLEMQSTVMQLRADNVLEAPSVEWSGLWGRPGTKWDLSVSMPFDWPGVYKARSQAAASMQQASATRRRLDIIDRAMEARRGIIEMIGLRQEMDLTSSLMALNDSLLTAYTAAYRHGEATILEVNRLRIEVLNLERQHSEQYTRLSQLEASLAPMAEHHDVRTLLGAVTDYPLEPMLPEGNYELLIARANPMTEYLAQMSEASQQQARVARLQRYPGLELGYTHEYDLGDRYNGFKVAVTLPVTSKSYATQAARLQAEAYDARMCQQRHEQLTLMHSAYQEALRLQREIAQYSEALDSADNMRLLGKALRGGQLSLLQYLQEVAYFTDARRSLLTARQAYHQALTTLWRYTL